MGGSDCSNSRDFRWIVPGSVLDGVRRRWNMSKREIMPEKDFENWHDWLKKNIGEREDPMNRAACIEGFFKGLKGKVFTAEQVVKILALRYPEEKV